MATSEDLIYEAYTENLLAKNCHLILSAFIGSDIALAVSDLIELTGISQHEVSITIYLCLKFNFVKKIKRAFLGKSEQCTTFYRISDKFEEMLNGNF